MFRALANDQHSISGWDARVVEAAPRDSSNAPPGERKRGTSEQPKREPRIFIDHIPTEITDQDLSSYFSQFGEVTTVHRPKTQRKDKDPGFSFAFLVFATLQGMAKALISTPHNIKGKELAITRAKERPPEARKGAQVTTEAPWAPGSPRSSALNPMPLALPSPFSTQQGEWSSSPGAGLTAVMIPGYPAFYVPSAYVQPVSGNSSTTVGAPPVLPQLLQQQQMMMMQQPINSFGQPMQNSSSSRHSRPPSPTHYGPYVSSGKPELRFNPY